MYAPAYGYGPGNPSAPFNPNGAPPQPQTPHHTQQPGQQPQHMMYNPQQYVGGVGPHQSPYGGPGPGMGSNAGAMGMMQNNGMAHIPGGHVPAYQTPYSSSPYGGNMPASSGASISFMPTTSNAPSFPMNAPNMNPQHQAQRMQPPPPSSTPTQPGPRASPFGNVQQHTPPNVTAQSQFSTPQNANQTHLQTPNNNQTTQGGAVLTPQTPNFPPGSQGANAGSNVATPLSPGSELREKERVTLLLDINRELLLECMRLNTAAQTAQNEAKKDESASSTASPDGTEKEKAEKEKEKGEKAKAPATREYFEYMRRLQCNLAYLAAIADRSHKPSSQIPAYPAIMSAPPPSPKTAQQNTSASSSPTTKKEEAEDKKSEKSEEDRAETIRELYKKLQALFPGVDPKKEPPLPNSAARVQAQQQAAQLQAQKLQNAAAADNNAQQKLQNDLLRQQMMQVQQAQQQRAQAQNAQQQQQGQLQSR